MPGQPQEGRALVRVALDDLRDVGRDGLVVDGVGGARCGGRDGRDDGGDGAAEDGAAFQRCRGFMGLRGSLSAAGAREALVYAGCWLPSECASPAGAPAGSARAAPKRRCLQRRSRRLGGASFELIWLDSWRLKLFLRGARDSKI